MPQPYPSSQPCPSTQAAPGHTPAPRPGVPPATRPFHYLDNTLAIDGLPLPAFAADHGTPLYLYSAANIRHRFGLFEEAFAPVPHTVCYAVKALSSLAVLQLLGQLGAGFDIVSGGELERVRRAHPPALERVVFSGVGKQAWEIDAALLANILLFNVESAQELDLLADRATALGKQARFALRVNPDVFAETHPYISTGLREHKFGIDIGLARELYRRAAQHPSLVATGVSVHIGSQIRAVAPFAQAVHRVAALVRDLRADGHPITHIDAGGGLGIDYHAPLEDAPARLAAEGEATDGEATQSARTTPPLDSDHPESHITGEPHITGESQTTGEFQTTGEPAPDTSAHLTPAQQVAAYAAALLPMLAGLDCHLLLEPGRFLVAQAGGLLTRVLGTKQNGTKRFLITDAAMNDLIRPALYQAHHEILPVTLRPDNPNAASSPPERSAAEAPASSTLQPVDVVGPVCESGDFFAHDRALPPLDPGDLVLLLDAGAYGMSQSSNYNTRPRAAELLIDAGVAHLIRRRETLADLLAPEQLLP